VGRCKPPGGYRGTESRLSFHCCVLAPFCRRRRLARAAQSFVGIWLGAAAACCATGAAVFDIAKNIRLLKVLNVPSAEITEAIAHGIRRASLLKWGLIFLTVGLLAPIFLWRSDWIVLIGYFYLSALIFGFVGVFFYRPAVGWAASYPMGLGLVVLAFLFTFWPKQFLQGF
jgi:hypothetical protein